MFLSAPLRYVLSIQTKSKGSSRSNPAVDEAEASDATNNAVAASDAVANAAETGPSQTS